jgi:hypothetical protein
MTDVDIEEVNSAVKELIRQESENGTLQYVLMLDAFE